MRLRNRKTSTRREYIRKSKQNERGFTLLETSIALCIMLVVTLATGSLFVYAINYNSGAADRSAVCATLASARCRFIVRGLCRQSSTTAQDRVGGGASLPSPHFLPVDRRARQSRHCGVLSYPAVHPSVSALQAVHLT